MTSSKEDFLARLNPKIAKNIKTASEVETRRFPLYSLGLTHALGGGVGAGRITTAYGNTSSGKSMLFMQTIGMLQKQGYVCGYGDAEGTWDNEFAKKLGVNVDELYLTQKKSFGAMTDTVIPWIEAEMDFLVIDSISDLLPEVFVEDGKVAEFENMKQLGAHAKSNTRMMNAIHYVNQKTAVVLLSQTTTMIAQTHTEQVPHGGKKIEFGSSQMIRLSSSATDAKQIKGELQMGSRLIEQPIGRHVEATVKKNKLGRQGAKAEYDIYYAGDNLGIDRVNELVTLAVTFGVIDKGGAWFKYNDNSWQGQPAVTREIKSNSALFKDIEDEVKIAMNGGVIE